MPGGEEKIQDRGQAPITPLDGFRDLSQDAQIVFTLGLDKLNTRGTTSSEDIQQLLDDVTLLEPEMIQVLSGKPLPDIIVEANRLSESANRWNKVMGSGEEQNMPEEYQELAANFPVLSEERQDRLESLQRLGELLGSGLQQDIDLANDQSQSQQAVNLGAMAVPQVSRLDRAEGSPATGTNRVSPAQTQEAVRQNSRRNGVG